MIAGVAKLSHNSNELQKVGADPYLSIPDVFNGFFGAQFFEAFIFNT